MYTLVKWRSVDDSFSKQNFTCLLFAIKQLLHQGKQIINTTCKMTPRTKLVVQTRWNRRCRIRGEKNRQTGHWLVSLAEVQFWHLYSRRKTNWVYITQKYQQEFWNGWMCYQFSLLINTWMKDCWRIQMTVQCVDESDDHTSDGYSRHNGKY